MVDSLQRRHAALTVCMHVAAERVFASLLLRRITACVLMQPQRAITMMRILGLLGSVFGKPRWF
jgi:hypothetical protein